VTATADTGELTSPPTAPTTAPTAGPAVPVQPTAPAPSPAVDPSGHRDAWATVRSAVTPRLSQGLTAPGGVLIAVLVLVPGVLLDLEPSGTFGTASTVCFLIAAVTAALVVRRRALGTAALLPPLLFVGAVAALAQLSGKNEGSRELVLDVGTTLAVDAPVLFVGTAATLAVVLGRLVVGLVRR
jgi:hypothetical protein